jgi:hypothetical protein
MLRISAVIVIVSMLASACGSSSPTSPSTDLTGTWAENFSFPGASLVLTLDASGNGIGTYAIEAGRSGTVQISGTTTQSMVTLVIRYDYGLMQTFTGSLTDASHLSGNFTNTGTVTFTRRQS